MKIRSDDEECDYAIFGKIVLIWGQVEAHLVNIIIHLSHPLFEPKVRFVVPINFDEKIKFAGKRYRDIPQLHHLSSQAEQLFAKLAPLHKTRTSIVHGDYQGYHYPDRYYFHFYHSKKNEKNRLGVFSFTPDELSDTIKELFDIKAELESFSRTTFLVSPPSARKAKQSGATP